jgi:tetratricopeptide (TPR) repeat protein
MLFDLRGRGRRRTVQAIYLSLALLMGGGLIFFGIGGATNGGLFDAFGGGNGNSTSADSAFQKRVDDLDNRVKANPKDAAAWAGLAKARFQLAGTGENFDETQQAYTDKGRAKLDSASVAWQRYLSLNPPRPDPTAANFMVQAYGQGGLAEYDKAVQAMEYVIDARPNVSALYAQLAVLAHGAKQDRKSTLSEQKAIELAPKANRKDLKTQIQVARSQLDQATQGQSQSG